MKKLSIFIIICAALAISACETTDKDAFTYKSDSSENSISSATSGSPISSESSKSSSSSSSIGGQTYNPADYYDGYYASLSTWQNGEDLKQKLHNIIHSGTYTALKYDYDVCKTADQSLTDFEFLDGLYTDSPIDKTKTNLDWQREHAFPASLMCGQPTSDATGNLGRATDYHNLFAASKSANSSRGNKNYGTANKEFEFFNDKTTNDGYDGYCSDNDNFEPGDHDKGRVARAIFYMATMYTEDESSKKGITMKGLSIKEDYVYYPTLGEGYSEYAIGNLSTLLSWNTFGVDDLEYQHNETVYSYVPSGEISAQGNRNPYIDYPELVDYVFGDKKDQGGNLADIRPTYLNLEKDKNEFSHYAIKTAKREYAHGEILTASDYTVVEVKKNGSYAITTQTVTNSLLDHTFASSDAKEMTATITIGTQTISYAISVVPPIDSCSYQSNVLKSTLSNSKMGEDQSITYGNVDWIFNVSGTSGFTFQNINSEGSPVGMKMGSGTKSITKVVLTTVNPYSINAAYIKAYAANKDSSFSLVIKVGDTVILNNKTVANNGGEFDIYGIKLNSPVTGKISFTFTGSNALALSTVAFNQVN